MEYITVDRLLNKIARDLKGTDIDETDSIEWIGEALDFLRVPQMQEEAVAILKVKNFQAVLPEGYQAILQVARNNFPNDDTICGITKETAVEPVPEPTDTNYLRFPISYLSWTQTDTYKQSFSPVRLANHSFFNTVVCKEKTEGLYDSCTDEYTLVGNKQLRFSFQEGEVAVAFLKNPLDPKTGYPYIPDNVIYITAITYYVKWKVAQNNVWRGREGYNGIEQMAEQHWLKYAKQAKNYMKMPKTLDEMQNLLEQTHKMIPTHDDYNSFYKRLGRPGYRRYNDPERRNII